MWIAAAEGSGIIEYSGCGGSGHEVPVSRSGQQNLIFYRKQRGRYFMYLNCKLWSKVNLSVSKYLDSNMQRSSLHRCWLISGWGRQISSLQIQSAGDQKPPRHRLTIVITAAAGLKQSRVEEEQVHKYSHKQICRGSFTSPSRRRCRCNGWTNGE